MSNPSYNNMSGETMIHDIGASVGGNCVCQENLSKKFCLTKQDILSTLRQIVCVWFLTNLRELMMDFIATSYSNTTVKQQHYCFPSVS